MIYRSTINATMNKTVSIALATVLMSMLSITVAPKKADAALFQRDEYVLFREVIQDNSITYKYPVYDDNSNLIQETTRYDDTNSCRIHTFEYDDDNNQVKFIDESYDENNQLYQKYVTESEFKDNHKTTCMTEYGPEESLIGITLDEYDYDDHKNQTTHIRYMGTSMDSLTLRASDGYEWKYDKDGCQYWRYYSNDNDTSYEGVQQFDKDGNLIYTDQYGYETVTEYKNGNIVHETAYNSENDDRYITAEYKYHYDSKGLLQFAEDVGPEALRGDGTYYVYNSKGNEIQAIQIKDGEVYWIQSKVYDQYDNLLTEWTNSAGELTVRTFDYCSADGKKMISGTRYDSQKYTMSYADNHPLSNELLIDPKKVYEQYSEEGFEPAIFSNYTVANSKNNDYQFDGKINITQDVSKNVVVESESYSFELPKSWATKVFIEQSGGNKNNINIYYISDKLKTKYPLITINYTYDNGEEELLCNGGDIGNSRCLEISENGKGTHLDVYFGNYEYLFWYDKSYGESFALYHDLTEEEKQEVLDLLYDGKVQYENIPISDEPDISHFEKIENSDWYKQIERSVVLFS